MPVRARFSEGPVLGPDFPLPLHLPFTTSEALSAGVSRAVLARLLRDGYVRRLLKSVHVAAQVPDSLLLRAQALRLVVPPHAVITDWTAVWLYTGVLPWGDHLRVPPVSLFVPSGRGRLRNGLCVSGERAFIASDLTSVGGLRVTTPLRTAWDVGRLSRRDTAIGGLDALLREGYFDPRDLVGGVERFRGERGVVQLRALAPIADGRSESPAESVLRLRWLDLTSLPQPEPQVPILDDRGVEIYRLDLGVRELRFAAEYDGEEFHTLDEDRDHDKERRTWIRRERGWIVKVLRRRNLFGPRRNVEMILNRGIDRARMRLRSHL